MIPFVGKIAFAVRVLMDISYAKWGFLWENNETICLYDLLRVNLVLDPAEGLIFELQVLILQGTVWVNSLPFSPTR